MQVLMILGSPNLVWRRWMTHELKAPLVGIATLVVGSLVGCGSTDERLVKLATDSSRRQADQSQDMARLQQQVAEGTKQLVASESAARREWMESKHDLQADLADIAKQRDALEAERRAMAAARHRDPLLAAAIETLGLVLACVIPLAAATYALRQTSHVPIDPTATMILINELTRRPQRTLPQPTVKPIRAPDEELPF